MENELKKRFGGGWYWLAMLANICRMTVGRMIDRYNEDQMRREEGQLKDSSMLRHRAGITYSPYNLRFFPTNSGKEHRYLIRWFLIKRCAPRTSLFGPIFHPILSRLNKMLWRDRKWSIMRNTCNRYAARLFQQTLLRVWTPSERRKSNMSINISMLLYQIYILLLRIRNRKISIQESISRDY